MSGSIRRVGGTSHREAGRGHVTPGRPLVSIPPERITSGASRARAARRPAAVGLPRPRHDMTHPLLLGIILAAAPAASPGRHPASLPAAPCAVCGDWEGKIDLGAVLQPMRVHITSAETGGLRGTIDLPTTGRLGFALSSVVVHDDSVRFTFEGRRGPASFAGRLHDDDGVTGQFWQA